MRFKVILLAIMSLMAEELMARAQVIPAVL